MHLVLMFFMDLKFLSQNPGFSIGTYLAFFRRLMLYNYFHLLSRMVAPHNSGPHRRDKRFELMFVGTYKGLVSCE
jgi:hypothetical protein